MKRRENPTHSPTHVLSPLLLVSPSTHFPCSEPSSAIGLATVQPNCSTVPMKALFKATTNPTVKGIGGCLCLTPSLRTNPKHPKSYKFQIASNIYTRWQVASLFKDKLELAPRGPSLYTCCCLYKLEEWNTRQGDKQKRLSWLPSHWEGGLQVTYRTSDLPNNQ